MLNAAAYLTFVYTAQRQQRPIKDTSLNQMLHTVSMHADLQQPRTNDSGQLGSSTGLWSGFASTQHKIFLLCLMLSACLLLVLSSLSAVLSSRARSYLRFYSNADSNFQHDFWRLWASTLTKASSTSSLEKPYTLSCFSNCLPSQFPRPKAALNAARRAATPSCMWTWLSRQGDSLIHITCMWGGIIRPS